MAGNRHLSPSPARALRALLIATALLLGAAAPAGAHSFSAQASGAVAGVKGMSEKQLRSFETRVLGPSHASEHAMMRRFARSAKGRALAARQARSAKRARTRARAAAVCDPATAAQVGCWTEDPFPIPVMGINMALLPTGKVLVYAYPSNPSWDPAPSPTRAGPRSSTRSPSSRAASTRRSTPGRARR